MCCSSRGAIIMPFPCTISRCVRRGRGVMSAFSAAVLCSGNPRFALLISRTVMQDV